MIHDSVRGSWILHQAIGLLKQYPASRLLFVLEGFSEWSHICLAFLRKRRLWGIPFLGRPNPRSAFVSPEQALRSSTLLLLLLRALSLFCDAFSCVG